MRLIRYIAPYQHNLNWFMNGFYAFLFSISAYLSMFRNLDMAGDLLKEKRFFAIKDEFDFIIVGAGGAGSVLADRLSYNYTVLLLEAGGEPHPLQLIPLLATPLLNQEEIDWQYKTVPQKHSSFAQKHRESLISAGKSLGGTSNLDGIMSHTRGSPKDFDAWATIVGDNEWTYENLLPFFKKHENYIDSSYRKYTEEDVHGHGGEVDIQVPPYINMADKYLEAVQELGYPIADLNGRFTEGFDYSHTALKNGRRQSSFSSFIEPIRGRTSLTIRKFAYVTKVLFGNESTAYGVKYDHHGVSRCAYAKREVILSAGPISTPKILMLSGIGPKEHLEDLGIPVLQDLPVGENLQNHAFTLLGPFFVNDSITFNGERDLSPFQLSDYISHGRGKLTSTGSSALGFISSKPESKDQGHWPDVNLILVGNSICNQCDKILSNAFNMDLNTMKTYFEHAKGRESFMQLVSNGRPLARGYVRLHSSDPYAPPIIDPKYLDNEHDVHVTIAGMKKAIEIVENTTVFHNLDGRFTETAFPGCEDKEFRSDAYFECYLRHFTISFYHVAGTCSMGRSPELGGVVDSKLQVFGTQRLRVVDASVMPQLTVGNTNSPTIMIGEKAADLILNLWQENKKV